MKILFSLFLGCALLTTQAAVATRRPKGIGKWASTQAKEARKHNPGMHFRHK